MKKLFLILAVMALVPGMASAASKKQAAAEEGQGLSPGGTDSCGLGWQVTDKKSFLATTTRGTTNGFIPPTFGMTSGTIGCEQHTFAKNDMNAVVYAATNIEPLSVEMAEGRGEFLQAFARTLGCDDSVMASFGQMTQQNYGTIMSGQNGVEVFKNVKKQISKNPVLSNSCKSTV